MDWKIRRSVWTVDDDGHINARASGSNSIEIHLVIKTSNKNYAILLLEQQQFRSIAPAFRRLRDIAHYLLDKWVSLLRVRVQSR